MKTRNDQIGIPVTEQANHQGRLIPFLAAVFLVGGVQAATQTFAYLFNYQSQLGANFHNIVVVK